MRKLIGSALMALMLVMTGVGSFAATQQPIKQVAAKVTMVTGEITQLKDHTLMLKDQEGKEHTFNLGHHPKMLEGLKSGEKVTVELENGPVTSIKKVAETKPAEQGTEAK